jgi:hypothetical protein
MTAGASIFAGALLGLLFGIPFTSNAATNGSTSNSKYRGNTNLEQISDWLTKLLVGAGLVQLGRAPSAFGRLANSLSGAFGAAPASAAFGLVVVFFYAGCGFFYLYLWSRLRLPKMLEAAEQFDDTVAALAYSRPPVNLSVKSAATPPQSGGDEVAADPGAQQLATAAATSAATTKSDVAASATASATQPQGALDELGRQMRTALRVVLASTGRADALGLSDVAMIDAVENATDAPPGSLDSVRKFFDAQSTYRSAAGSADENLLDQAIQSGTQILAAVQSIPREHHIVVDPNVALFSDGGCTQPMEGVHGVILQSGRPDDASIALRIFPSTGPLLRVGDEVSWEWNSSNIYPAAWYLDGGGPRKAWEGSSEFTGRPLSSLA